MIDVGGAILAILTVYSARLWKIATNLPSDARTRRFVFGVLVAFLPAAVIGVAAVLLLVAIALFWRVRRMAALLLLPYLGWVCFAGALNYAFIQANPDGGNRDASGATTQVTL